MVSQSKNTINICCFASYQSLVGACTQSQHGYPRHCLSGSRIMRLVDNKMRKIVVLDIWDNRKSFYWIVLICFLMPTENYLYHQSPGQKPCNLATHSAQLSYARSLAMAAKNHLLYIHALINRIILNDSDSAVMRHFNFILFTLCVNSIWRTLALVSKDITHLYNLTFSLSGKHPLNITVHK